MRSQLVRPNPTPADLALVGMIYDAALDPEMWPDFLRELSAEIRADAGALCLFNLMSRELTFMRCFGPDESTAEADAREFAQVEPFLGRIEAASLEVFRAEQVLPREELIGTEYYRNWLSPEGAYHHANGVVYLDDARIAMVDLLRSRRMGAFSETDLDRIALLVPHLRRAMLLNQKFWDLLSKSDAALGVLEHLEIGVIFLDEQERPFYLNKLAKQLTRFGDGVIVNKDGVSAGYEQQAEALQALVHDAVQTGLGRGIEAGGVIRVGIREDSPHFVLVTPLRSSRTDLGLGSHVCAAMFIASPHHPYAVSVEALRTLHGLTRAETQVVGELANGMTLDQIAEHGGITKHTVRDHLKSIFAKTGLRRQVELIRLVRATPTTYVNEAILLGTPLAGPIDRRQSIDRRLDESRRLKVTEPQMHAD